MNPLNNPYTPAAALKGDFADIVNLFDRLTHAENQLAKLQQALDADHLEAVRGHMPVYKELQTTIGECNAAIAVISKRNPQWFEEKKTVTTPFGEVKRTTSISIEIADPAVTITLIKAAKREDDFLKTVVSVRLEALEALDDAQLAKFGVKRVTEHNFKAGPATVDLGKAVKAAEKSDKAAAKAAKSAKSQEAAAS